MNTERISRNEYYMKVAENVAERSTCERAKVGAILVDPHSGNIVATGFNGSVSKGPHCLEVGCLLHEGHCIRTIHAELNAILHLERNYNVLYLYCTHQPCHECIKALLGAHVYRIYYLLPYEDKVRDLILKDLGKELDLQMFQLNLT